MYRAVYGAIGLKDLDLVLSPKKQATRNFHGQYYLDSDKLEQYLHFRKDSLQYFYACYLQTLGALAKVSKALCRLPGGQRLMDGILRRRFDKLARIEHGTIRFTEENVQDHIDADWGGRSRWDALPERHSDMQHFARGDQVVPIDHGYDESKPEGELTLEDVQGAAKFRGAG